LSFWTSRLVGRLIGNQFDVEMFSCRNCWSGGALREFWRTFKWRCTAKTARKSIQNSMDKRSNQYRGKEELCWLLYSSPGFFVGEAGGIVRAGNPKTASNGSRPKGIFPLGVADKRMSKASTHINSPKLIHLSTETSFEYPLRAVFTQSRGFHSFWQYPVRSFVRRSEKCLTRNFIAV